MTEQEFLENLIKNLEKNGYPHKKVSFGLEKLYESAHLKGLNFNKILDLCHQRGIDHEKTSTKIIFYKLLPIQGEASPSGGQDAQFPNDFFSRPINEQIAYATQMLQNMSPEQLDSIKNTVLKMSPQEREELMEKARKLGIKNPS